MSSDSAAASTSAATPKQAQAPAAVDGTTDYKPLRGAGTWNKKVHIADTPMTWGNWYKHVDWLNTFFIVIVPIIGFISAYWVPLHLYTAIFAVIYYFNTGLGITAGKFSAY